eukprot:8003589-Alexandrium_andersonii.AAC.1
MWSDTYAVLDLEAQPQGCRLWKSKARGSLLGKFPRIGSVLDWAEKQLEPISELRQRDAAHLLAGFDVAQVSRVIYSAVQRIISDRVRMAKPELARDALGLELWRLLVREHVAPKQPVVQREFQKRWACPRRCRGAAELRARLPEWEVWGRELE